MKGSSRHPGARHIENIQTGPRVVYIAYPDGGVTDILHLRSPPKPPATLDLSSIRTLFLIAFLYRK